jgi:hypothetical protein
MGLANMREQGVTHLVAFCHNDPPACHASLRVSRPPADQQPYRASQLDQRPNQQVVRAGRARRK